MSRAEAPGVDPVEPEGRTSARATVTISQATARSWWAFRSARTRTIRPMRR